MKSYPARRALLSVVNSSIREESFPSALKTARVVPVPKVSQPKSPSELHPIDIQPHLAKLFEKCPFDQLYCYLEKYGILTEHQFGFRRGHSTTHACISIADYVYESLDQSHVCFIISLDIIKAFDTIDRDILIQKLAWCGIRSNHIWSFINDRVQFVSIVKSESTLSSSLKKTILGLAQGSSLSNLLFAVMINDLVCSVKNCKVKLYADDSNLHISGRLEDVQLLISMIEIDLAAITQ
jgi:hypothetical protein